MLETSGLNDSGQDVSDFNAPDLSPEEYAEHTAGMVANSVEATKLIQVIEVRAGVGQVRLMGRVRRDDEKEFLRKVFRPILEATRDLDDCEAHTCKPYMLRGSDMVYAWEISFAARDLRQAANSICLALEPSIPRMEVTAMPMHGPATPTNSGVGSKSRGAAVVGA